MKNISPIYSIRYRNNKKINTVLKAGIFYILQHTRSEGIQTSSFLSATLNSIKCKGKSKTEGTVYFFNQRDALITGRSQ